MRYGKHNGPPMTLGNMRANGVRRLSVSCWQCHHSAVIDVDGLSDEIPVPSFGPRMVCTFCGIIGCDARPNWTDLTPAGLYPSTWGMGPSHDP
jgi:hypothetical protein